MPKKKEYITLLTLVERITAFLTSTVFQNLYPISIASLLSYRILFFCV